MSDLLALCVPAMCGHSGCFFATKQKNLIQVVVAVVGRAGSWSVFKKGSSARGAGVSMQNPLCEGSTGGKEQPSSFSANKF